ncbi:hypothetical protein EYF80_033451 [Liparis tanakae]|uniref:Uncharacterized protein n=1 Tax=Liparis tanakae TaxID=230148 RepID=A0A4Z2GSY2_9TELE|nr:hypothetical protein EYF80_033451 [Liparis tanakae]
MWRRRPADSNRRLLLSGRKEARTQDPIIRPPGLQQRGVSMMVLLTYGRTLVACITGSNSK